MQNRYAGDIGDFGKLGLLRTLYAAGFSVGVNWYLNPNLTSKELNNKDGKFVDYSQYKNCDEQLYSELKRIISCGQRKMYRHLKIIIFFRLSFTQLHLIFPIKINQNVLISAVIGMRTH